MDEGQERGTTGSHLPVTKYVRRVTSYRRKCLETRSWRFISASLWTRVSSFMSSSFSGIENSGLCTKAISSMLKPLNASLTVWQITLDVDASCDSSSVDLIIRMLHAGILFSVNGMSISPIDATRQLANKVQFQNHSQTASGCRLYWSWRQQKASPRWRFRCPSRSWDRTSSRRRDTAPLRPLWSAGQHARDLQGNDWGFPCMKSVLHAEVLAALRRVVSVLRVRLRHWRLHIVASLDCWDFRRSCPEATQSPGEKSVPSTWRPLSIKISFESKASRISIISFRCWGWTVFILTSTVHVVLRLGFDVKIPWHVMRLYDSSDLQLVPIVNVRQDLAHRLEHALDVQQINVIGDLQVALVTWLVASRPNHTTTYLDRTPRNPSNADLFTHILWKTLKAICALTNQSIPLVLSFSGSTL